ncbi:ankyrin repeat and LEM domain-containing protein 1 [Callorhinchus milii]|uniref:ankyrin repeat and LEM domain-containing protein 1 n=1 Tax=Callorhinchus milii TaxID=7868 RepID=UPI001C3F9A1B|nr:ankyrin repeat and LEM domain-containing protein 1 [Callorhinchus milii]
MREGAFPLAESSGRCNWRSGGGRGGVCLNETRVQLWRRRSRCAEGRLWWWGQCLRLCRGRGRGVMEAERLARNLHHAVEEEEAESVERWLRKNADPNLVLPEGLAAVHLASVKDTEGGLKCLKLILQHQGDPNLGTVEDLTPLHIAASWGCLKSLKLLLRYGGDPSLQDQDGMKPEDLAEEQKNMKCVRILKEYRQLSLNQEPLDVSPKHQYVAASPPPPPPVDGRPRFFTDPTESLAVSPPPRSNGGGGTVSSSGGASGETRSTGPRAPGPDGQTHTDDRGTLPDTSTGTGTARCDSPEDRASLSGLSAAAAEDRTPGPLRPDPRAAANGRLSEPVDASLLLFDDEGDGAANGRDSPPSGDGDSDSSSELYASAVEGLNVSPDPGPAAGREGTPGRGGGGSGLAVLLRKATSDPKRRESEFEPSPPSPVSSSASAVTPRSGRRDSSLFDRPVPAPARVRRVRSPPRAGEGGRPVVPCRRHHSWDGRGSDEGVDGTPLSRSSSSGLEESYPDTVPVGAAVAAEALEGHRVTVRSPRGGPGGDDRWDDDTWLTEIGGDEDGGGGSRCPALPDPEGCPVPVDRPPGQEAGGRGSSGRSPPADLLSNSRLRLRLRDLGADPGPVTRLTRNVYLRRLNRLVAEPRAPRRRPPKAVTKMTRFAAEFSAELCRSLETFVIPDCRQDELILSQQFDQPDQIRRWRGGLVKSSFNYLLLDPRVTMNLPARSHALSDDDCFRIFVNAIFYVGKGKRSRPYSHLNEAQKHFNNVRAQVNSKLQRIMDIWADGLGVISLHCFQNVIAVEAFTREACMVDALGLPKLTNQKRGDYYGTVATWTMKRRRQLGVHLIRQASLIFLAEGERQLRPADI